MCVIDDIILVVGIPRPMKIIRTIIIDKEIIDAGREYMIIEGFPINRGTIIDFRKDII